MTIQRSKVMLWALRFYVYTIIVKVTRKNSTLGWYEQIQPQGPVLGKMVKCNPGISQISIKVFLSKNMSLQLTKDCCVFTPRFGDDNTHVECYSKQYMGRYMLIGLSGNRARTRTMKQLAKRVWFTKLNPNPQSYWILTYVCFSGFQSPLLLMHFHSSANTCLHCWKEWHRNLSDVWWST